MAKFQTLSAMDFDPCLKVRIQKSGKIGFGADVIKCLGLTEDMYVRFVYDEESSNKQLYMALTKNGGKTLFQIKKVGPYYNINTPRMFDSLGVDYKNNAVYMIMVRMPEYDSELDGDVYRLDYEYKSNDSTVENMGSQQDTLFDVES